MAKDQTLSNLIKDNDNLREENKSLSRMQPAYQEIIDAN